MRNKFVLIYIDKIIASHSNNNKKRFLGVDFFAGSVSYLLKKIDKMQIR